MVRPDDVLTIAVGGHVRVLEVKDLGTRRGPFAEACQLYEDLTSGPSATKKTVHKARTCYASFVIKNRLDRT